MDREAKQAFDNLNERLDKIEAEVQEQNERSVRQTQRIMSFLRDQLRGGDERDPQ